MVGEKELQIPQLSVSRLSVTKLRKSLPAQISYLYSSSVLHKVYQFNTLNAPKYSYLQTPKTTIGNQYY